MTSAVVPLLVFVASATGVVASGGQDELTVTLTLTALVAWVVTVKTLQARANTESG